MRLLLSDERRNRILEMINARGSVSVKDLSQALDVSEMTIRRDLHQLASGGFIKRIHGGASPSSSTGYEPPFGAREERNLREKKIIGRCAANLVGDGETLIMDVGTTTLEVARNLKGVRNLTILTNSIPIAKELSVHPDFSVYLMGGLVRGREMSTVGSMTEESFRSFCADKAIMGTGGISSARGLSNFDVAEAHVRRSMLEAARQVIIVADSSKFGRDALITVSSLDRINYVVTDTGAPEGEIQEMGDMGVQVIIAGRDESPAVPGRD